MISREHAKEVLENLVNNEVLKSVLLRTDIEAMKCAISALSENKGEWIPVSERLPEDDTDVVYCTEMGTVGSCHYFEGFNHYSGCSQNYIFDDIVAWFPIPEVPLEKDWWNASREGDR